jgi:two-component system, OmpR family, phosphate regulon sensor histidine kinase PhoR
VGWIAFSLLLVGAVWAGFYVWRRWIDPWREVDELLGSIAGLRPPRKFLMTGNRRATEIGRSIEKIAMRLRELEQRAQERDFSVQAVFGAMLDGLVVVDAARRVRMSNREFGRIFGVDGSTPDVPLVELIGHATIDRVVSEAIKRGEPQRESIQISRGPSEGRELEVSAVPLGADSPFKGGAVVIFRDVTQIRQVEEMRRDFVANVSHELRTPLSIFRGYLETLLDDPQQPPGELMRILEIMERHSDRLNALVEDVLSLARLESPEIELDLGEIDLQEFLTATLTDWGSRLKAKQLRFNTNIQADLPPLCADEGRLQEIVYNLLDNAVKYSKRGGTITVQAQREGDRIHLRVTDEGIGIRESDVPRIFERFYRADKARSRELGGTGLGLSIVKHIVQLHGGSVGAQSELGRGTTVSVYLPVHGPADPQTRLPFEERAVT